MNIKRKEAGIIDQVLTILGRLLRGCGLTSRLVAMETVGQISVMCSLKDHIRFLRLTALL